MAVRRKPEMHIARFEREPVLFEQISRPRGVTRLEIAFCNVQSLAGIEVLANLEEIHIYYCRELNETSQLERLPRLRKINLFCLPNVEVEFRPARISGLVDLSYNNVHRLSSLRGIEKLKHLGSWGSAASRCWMATTHRL